MAKSNKFGTFGGVFTPSILTILGVIMYMRLPMIIGQAGLYATIGIILVAHIISLTTGLSVSSIATDKKVEAGGTYFMISRSLGLPIGGTLGLALFVGLSFSVSLYLIGFSESFLGSFGYDMTINNIRIAGSAILLLVTIITFISTSLALKTQYFIMAAIFLSLLSILFGKHDFAPASPVLFPSSGTAGIMILFGIFFPAVTGFEAGVSMSGDLKDPKKSIPLGSISAIVIGLVVYIGLVFFFSYTVNGENLANDPKILLKVSRVPQLVIAGIWGATLSSALGSILGAPRILQATAVDKITPRFFAKGKGASNEPRNALLLTFLIAEAGILIGELDIIARIVSVFFITTYGFLNLSCAFEAMTSADFRPSFKTPAWVSLLGSLACMLVMIQLDFVAMLGATILLGFLYTFLKRKELVLQTGDAWSSIWASLVKTGLKRLKQEKLQSRNWRPNIIMFSGASSDRPALIDMGKNISGRLGMLTGFQLQESKQEILVKELSSEKEPMEGNAYFKNIHQCRDIYSGMDEVVRVYGYSGMEPNTILMGWSRNPARKKDFLQLISRLEKNNFNSLFLSKISKNEVQKKTIDIWWSGWGHNLSFSLSLVRHLTGSLYWKDARIRLLVESNDSAGIELLHHSIKKVLEMYRVDIELKIINNAIEQLPRNSLILRESINTELSIIGIPNSRYEQIDSTYEEVNQLVSKMGSVLLINASNNFEAFDLLQSTFKADSMKPDATEKHEIPSLLESEFPEATELISAIDKQGMADLRSFFESAIATGFHECNSLMKEVTAMTQTLYSNFEKIEESKDKHRKLKFLSKARNDYFFKAQKVFLRFLDEKLEYRTEMLGKGLEDYLRACESMANSQPKKLKLEHDKSEFLKNISDARVLSRFKRRKRIAHPFAKSIKIRSNFRKVSHYYLLDSRIEGFSEVLEEIQNFDLSFLSQFRNFLIRIHEVLESKEVDVLNLAASKTNAAELKREMDETLLHIKEDLNKAMLDVDYRLRLEFRNASQSFMYNIDKLRVNKIVQSERNSARSNRKLLKQITSFNDRWYNEIRNYANRIYIDLIIHATRDRVIREIEDFEYGIINQVNTKILNPIRSVRKKLEKSVTNKSSLKAHHELQGGTELDLLQDTEKHLSDIQMIIDSLPEEIIISDTIHSDKQAKFTSNSETENIPIPVRRIVRHYIDSIFLTSLLDSLKKFLADLRKHDRSAKEHLSYLEFEVENLDIDETDIEAKKQEIIKETLNEIDSVEQNIENDQSALFSEIRKSIRTAFEPASSHLIADSSKKIAHLIREYQGKQTVSRFGAIQEKAQSFIKSKTVRLLYSQSEGILFARKLTEAGAVRSDTEKLADVLDRLRPSAEVQSKIPAYYLNLFSGKSSIGEDFWIDRTFEESSFDKALQRYRRIKKGGVIIYGERNSGKTALSKFLTRKYFKSESVFHIFPPWQGSSKIEDFNAILQKATGMRGAPASILDSLPFDSVLVFHDLELWWERTDEGFEVIQRILDIVDSYSHKFLIISNINLYAYNFLNELHQIEDHFLATIKCRPFDSEDLKELVMRRHRSSGLLLSFGKRMKEQVSEVTLAAIFNRLFRVSEGNPGLALNLWLSMIKKYSNNKLIMEKPAIHDFGFLTELSDDWMIILAQIVLHKRGTAAKLAKVLGMEQSEITHYLNSMLMAGVLVERNSNLFIIDAYLHNEICDVLAQNELI